MRYAYQIHDSVAMLLNQFPHSFIVSVFCDALYAQVVRWLESPCHIFARYNNYNIHYFL